MKKNIYTFFAAALLTISSNAQTQKGLDIYGEAVDDQSGYSVSMPDANTVAIGAIYNDGTASNSGHVRIYRWNGMSWSQKGADINGEASGDQSGYSVSMPDANTVAIGAPYNDGTASNAGHVRVYNWNGTSWSQKGADIDGEAGNDKSGWSVSMPDANTVAIGALDNDGTSSNSGHVRIYSWNGTSWSQKGADIDGEAFNDWSGYSVSMPDANTVAIGATLNDGNGADAGHVRIYSWNGTSWSQKGTDIDGEAADDWFGTSVSMPDANTVAIGAMNNDGTGTDAGHVQIFTWDGTNWIQKGADIDGEAAYDGSGQSVSMPDANTVAIGATGNDGSGHLNGGHVRVYTWDGLWIQKGVDINSEAANDWFGTSVSMPDANTVAIGGPLNDGNGALAPDAGHVKVLTFCSSSSSTINETFCDGGTYTSPSGSYTWSSAGTYFDTIPNASGCDSLMTINLTFDNSVDCGLIRHYKLDGDADDYSGNNYHGTVYGATVADRYGLSDQCYRTVSDNGEKIDVPNAGNWGDNLVISMWFNPDSLQSSNPNSTIFFSRVATGGQINFFSNIQHSDSTILFYVASDNGSGQVASSNKVNIGEWNHIVFYHDGLNNKLGVVLNGITSETSWANTPRYLNKSIGFGNNNAGVSPANGFNGRIDDIRFYDRQLPQQHIDSLGNPNAFPTSILERKDGLEDNFFYPNPATANITFNKQLDEVRIYNISGQLMLTHYKVQQVKVNALTPGVYFVKTVVNEAIQTSKLIIQ